MSESEINKPIPTETKGYPNPSFAEPTRRSESLGRVRFNATDTLSMNLGLDEYDDIFSDFDARPYSARMLSEDFLHELKRASLGQEEDGVVLNLLLPQARRNAATDK